MAAAIEAGLNRIWYGQSAWRYALLPLSWLFGLLAALRRRLFLAGILRRRAIGVPVVVVGNLTAGGTGKTPVTIWLALELARRGYRPGVASRGYGTRAGRQPELVGPQSDPARVGDEPVLIARRAGCPVAVHPDRVAAARALVAAGVDLVISDDGLQHYRLGRDLEVAVVDGDRLWGNGLLLPAGPLRERPDRLGTVDRVLVQAAGAGAGPAPDAVPGMRFTLVPGDAVCLADGTARPLAAFRGERPHAVAGIGSPERFFRMLGRHGIGVDARALPDHAAIRPADVDFGDDRPVLMTEKDAVKCGGFATGRHWYVPVELRLDGDAGGWVDELVRLLQSRTKRHD